ncbi:MAG TPA: hypothetical protein VKV28_16980 [Candidatus Binataceae bacterium]|nr:hypothetical protein [Candidatus Binataceae bacterium]
MLKLRGLSLVAVALAVGVFWEAAWSQTTPQATRPSHSNPTLLHDSRAVAAMQAHMHKVLHTRHHAHDAHARAADILYLRAVNAFPSFCQDWGRKLQSRDVNNVDNVSWRAKDGWETGTYIVYSPIKSCNTKRAANGQPIGELTYQETEYYLAGHTITEARHAQPKPVSVTNTTEIFRWDRTHWDY